MKRLLIAPLLILAGIPAAHAAVSDGSAHDVAEKRLRGCIMAGSSSGQFANLAQAVQHVRALCGAQIKDLADIRVGDAAQGLEGLAAEDAKKQTLRKLNDEIAYAVANFTGLTQ